MVYYFIALSGNTETNSNIEDQNWKKIKSQVIPKFARGQTLEITKEQFRFGNLDSLFYFNDLIEKHETTIEGLLKKIDKQYKDFDKKIEADQQQFMIGDQDLNDYITRFEWDESKYASNNKIGEILNLIMEKVNQTEQIVRQQQVKYTKNRNAIAQFEKSESGNLLSRNLNTVFSPEVCSEDDFMCIQDSKWLSSLIAFVPKIKQKLWEEKYEFLSDGVVPGSTKNFPSIRSKDGMQLYRVVCMEKLEDELIDKAKSEMKITIRRFTYDPNTCQKQENKKEQLQEQKEEIQNSLQETCETAFSEIYIAYAHMKMLKLLLESVIQYGNKEKVMIMAMKPHENQESQCLEAMLNQFCESGQREMYSTKEKSEDGRHYFPFALVELEEY